MKTLEELEASVLEDGVVDGDEVVEIRKTVYDDGVIDEEEADFMFRINNAVSGKDNHQTWEDLFVEVVGDYVLKDEESPGAIDEGEAKYLIDQIEGDGTYDDAEKALIGRIQREATSIHPTLADFMERVSA